MDNVAIFLQWRTNFPGVQNTASNVWQKRESSKTWGKPYLNYVYMLYIIYVYIIHICMCTHTNTHTHGTYRIRERERERAEVFKQGKQNNVILLKENKSRGLVAAHFTSLSVRHEAFPCQLFLSAIFVFRRPLASVGNCLQPISRVQKNIANRYICITNYIWTDTKYSIDNLNFELRTPHRCNLLHWQINTNITNIN